MYRVGLISRNYIEVYRLDVAATRAYDPPGAATSGYDDVLGEPIPYDDTTELKRESSRQELSPVQIPCQVEEKTTEELQQEFTGDAPLTQYCFVLHREELRKLGLIDLTTNQLILKKNDRIAQVLDSARRPLFVFDPPLYIFEAKARGWGMGPRLQDLFVIFTSNRQTTAAGA